MPVSGRIEIINTGKPYRESCILRTVGGTREKPLVIEGNNAVITGLKIVPLKNWNHVKDNTYSTKFWPMSNRLRNYKKIQHWLDKPKICWINNKAAKNCKNEKELLKGSSNFYWNKPLKQLWINLPEGKTPADFKIEIPVWGTSVCINTDWVIVQNLRSRYSMNDGFDTHKKGKNIVFKNCVSRDNCGQGVSTHNETSSLYENCHNFRNTSSGICNIGNSITMFKNCLIADNAFEAGVYGGGNALIIMENCLIINNKPFEQIWQRSNSKLFFINCMIVGAQNNKGLLSMHNGSMFFSQCTFIGGAYVCNIPKRLKSRIAIINSIFANSSSFVLKIPESSKDRVSLANNVYLGNKGNIFNRKKYNSSNWDEYLETGIEKNSICLEQTLKTKNNPEFKIKKNWSIKGTWKKTEFSKEILSVIPENSSIKLKKNGEKCRIGADISKKLWNVYFKEMKLNSNKQF